MKIFRNTWPPASIRKEKVLKSDKKVLRCILEFKCYLSNYSEIENIVFVTYFQWKCLLWAIVIFLVAKMIIGD